jgi:hypothetical protein
MFDGGDYGGDPDDDRDDDDPPCAVCVIIVFVAVFTLMLSVFEVFRR